MGEKSQEERVFLEQGYLQESQREINMGDKEVKEDGEKKDVESWPVSWSPV